MKGWYIIKITIDMQEEIDINDLIGIIKRFYPNKKINSITHQNNTKKIFYGIDDLKVLPKDDFKIYPRDELYDR